MHGWEWNAIAIEDRDRAFACKLRHCSADDLFIHGGVNDEGKANYCPWCNQPLTTIETHHHLAQSNGALHPRTNGRLRLVGS
jgi:hypothetical protein